MSKTASVNANEWALLHAACSPAPQHALGSLHSLLNPQVHWTNLFDLAESHGLTPLLYEMLSHARTSVPTEHMQALECAYQTNLHKALLLSRELIRVVDSLRSSGLNILPYKGVALAETVYGDIALRHSGDIDLLIHPNDFLRARTELAKLGYQPHLTLSELEMRAFLKSGYECAFDSPAGPNLLEIQWAIQPRFYAVDFDLDGLFRRALPVSVAGHPMMGPSSEDLFLILSLHAAKHVWGRLIWLSDLARIMILPTLDWKWINAEARKLGIERIVRVTLLLAHQFTGTAISDAADVCFQKDTEAKLLADQIGTQIINNTPLEADSFAYFRLMLRLRERVMDRLRFLGRLVFTPGPSEWKAIHLPPPLFPLYRLVRLSRLAARIVNA
jgi:hypothetical protein